MKKSSPCEIMQVFREADHNSDITNTPPLVSRPAVIITGPPWPRSGTARVIQNQVDFYRDRGYFTVFICVPLHNSYTDAHPGWDDIKREIQELRAEQNFFAPIDNRRFVTGKYLAWVGHSFRGTALDWIVFTSKSAQLPVSTIRYLRSLDVALIHVNHVFTLGFAQRLLQNVVRPGCRVPMILDTHDVQSNAMNDRGEINPWTHRQDRFDRLLKSEIALLNKVDVLVHVSVDDSDFFKRRLPHKHHVLAMPTMDKVLDFDLDLPRQALMDPFDLLFVGHGTPPNADGIQWFFEQVWPLIDSCGYRVKIVGGIEAWVRKEMPSFYQAFRPYFVGSIAELTPAYHAARCVFAPMVSGTGISIKTIEALAFGKPFVGTSKAYRGMPLDIIKRIGLHVYDTPRSFADGIAYALSSEDRAAATSRAVYDRLFSNEASFSARDEALELAAAERVSS